MTGKRVIVLGGGVAGMSVAHELIARQFNVVVYEKTRIAGGKARSIPFENSAAGQTNDGQARQDLPGEHGFRFFPGFYQHLFDTMKRIPFPGNPKGVFGNLQLVNRGLIAIGNRSFEFGTAQPKSLQELLAAFETVLGLKGLVPDLELFLFARKIWQILCSCDERRLKEFENRSWWDFVEAPQRSPAYQKYLAIGSTRSLVASQAQLASTKTIGDIGIQLLFNFTLTDLGADYVLNGPTSDVWLNPWLRFLQAEGVDYRFGATVQAINCRNGVIESVDIQENNAVTTVRGDYYVVAVPLEIMAGLLNSEMLQADPRLQGIKVLKDRALRWMNGIQFYLKQPVGIKGDAIEGHLNFLDSDWALTAIFQQQYWPQFNLSQYGDGMVREILSVVISDWETKGLQGKSAKECTREEIVSEVWKQMKASLNPLGNVLEDNNIHSTFIDPDIQSATNGPPYVNAEPLMVNLVGTWDLRPEAETRIPNLFLAGDYVRTNTDLATMESANEAARRSVNGILNAEKSTARPCDVWPLFVPDEIQKLRRYDSWLYKIGLPPPSLDAWKDNFPRIKRLKNWIVSLFR